MQVMLTCAFVLYVCRALVSAVCIRVRAVRCVVLCYVWLVLHVPRLLQLCILSSSPCRSLTHTLCRIAGEVDDDDALPSQLTMKSPPPATSSVPGTGAAAGTTQATGAAGTTEAVGAASTTQAGADA